MSYFNWYTFSEKMQTSCSHNHAENSSFKTTYQSHQNIKCHASQEIWCFSQKCIHKILFSLSPIFHLCWWNTQIFFGVFRKIIKKILGKFQCTSRINKNSHPSQLKWRNCTRKMLTTSSSLCGVCYQPTNQVKNRGNLIEILRILYSSWMKLLCCCECHEWMLLNRAHWISCCAFVVASSCFGFAVRRVCRLCWVANNIKQ